MRRLRIGDGEEWDQVLSSDQAGAGLVGREALIRLPPPCGCPAPAARIFDSVGHTNSRWNLRAVSLVKYELGQLMLISAQRARTIRTHMPKWDVDMGSADRTRRRRVGRDLSPHCHLA